MELLPVQISKSETCISYALKRVGLWGSLITPEITLSKVDTYFEKTRFDLAQPASKGSIVYWDNKKKRLEAAWAITADREILSQSIMVNIHAGVIEDDYCTLVSDCTRTSLEFPIPNLRLRKFSKQVRYPDWVLTLKSEYFNKPAGIRFIDKIFKPKSE